MIALNSYVLSHKLQPDFCKYFLTSSIFFYQHMNWFTKCDEYTQDIHWDWHTTIISKSKRKERKKNYVLYITDGCKYIYIFQWSFIKQYKDENKKYGKKNVKRKLYYNMYKLYVCKTMLINII